MRDDGSIQDKTYDWPVSAMRLLSQMGAHALGEDNNFDYQLIGYRSGKTDYSVILKKGNMEYVVSDGDKLEGIYELVSVNEDEVIFSNQGKIYKIKNTVGK